MPHTTDCANCGRDFAVPEQAYCPGCGQPTPAHRIDWPFMRREFEESVLQLERGILFTLKQLMLRPGRLLRDYLEGRRAPYVKPLMLIMLTSAAAVLVAKYAAGGTLMDPAAGEAIVRANGGAPPGFTQIYAQVQSWMNQNFALSTLLLLPLEAAAFWLVFRRVRGLNYPEWLVITAYLTAQTFILWTLALCLKPWVPAAASVGVWLGMGYAVVSLMQLFREEPAVKIAVRGVLAFLLYLLASGVVSALGVGMMMGLGWMA